MSDIDRKVSYWIDLAEYDLESANVMLEGGRYLYVGFMCHQVIEKALKALVWKLSGSAPAYTHSLARLIRETEIDQLLPSRYRSLLDVLEPLNIETRYPTDRERLIESLDRARSQSILGTTKEFYEWIKARL